MAADPHAKISSGVQAAFRFVPHSFPVGELRQSLALNRKLFSRLTGYSERAIADWESGKEVSDSTRQRMMEIRRLQEALSRLMEPHFVGQWLQSPNPAFAGLKPLEVVERGEIDRIWQMVHLFQANSRQ